MTYRPIQVAMTVNEAKAFMRRRKNEVLKIQARIERLQAQRHLMIDTNNANFAAIKMQIANETGDYSEGPDSDWTVDDTPISDICYCEFCMGTRKQDKIANG